MENITDKKRRIVYKGCLKETLELSALNFPAQAVARGTYNDLAKIEEDIRKTVKVLPKGERVEVLNSLKTVLEGNLKLINSRIEGIRFGSLKASDMEPVEMDLYEITKNFTNTQRDYPIAMKALKSWILGTKIERGWDVIIKIKDRHSDCIPFDLWVNVVAKKMLENWDMTQ